MIKAISEYVDVLISARRYDIINEAKIIDSITNLPLEDLSKLKNLFIKTAKSNRFNDNDYKNWGNPGYKDKEENERLYNKFKSYKLGYCFRDYGDNYICYNFETDTFHFFDHEEHGCENMERKAWSIERIAKYIKNME